MHAAQSRRYARGTEAAAAQRKWPEGSPPAGTGDATIAYGWAVVTAWVSVLVRV